MHQEKKISYVSCIQITVQFTSSSHLYMFFFELEIHTVDVIYSKFSLIFYTLTALLDFFRVKYVFKTISNKRPPYYGSACFLENGRLKGRGIYKIFSKIGWAFIGEERWHLLEKLLYSNLSYL